MKAKVRFGGCQEKINGHWIPYNGAQYRLEARAVANGAVPPTVVWVEAQYGTHGTPQEPSRLLVYDKKGGDMIGAADLVS